jgi:non-homologous end joining protein Ku
MIDLAEYKNDYAEALKKLVEAKKSGEPIEAVDWTLPKKEVDLTELLMASLGSKGV